MAVRADAAHPMEDQPTLRRVATLVAHGVGQVTGLVTAAIAGAEARGDLQRLSDEHAALRRVAALVSHRAPADETLAGVAREVATLLPAVDGALILRYEADRTATVRAGWGEPALASLVGARLAVDGDHPVADVLRTSRPARGGVRATPEGQLAGLSRDAGIRCSVACPVIVDARLWGAVLVLTRGAAPLPPGTEARMADVTELLGAAIGAVETRADLDASRARIVGTADRARRRFERDLHDGVQQRLVSVALDLRGIEGALPDEPRRRLALAVSHLDESVEALRDLSHGLHPAVLSSSGLGPALRALARRSAVPVALDLDLERRLAEPVEVAAYFIVSEALTNTAKHAGASSVRVRVGVRDGTLELAVADDGRGGADPARGTGLLGLIDRVAALGGVIALESPPARGTTLDVWLPLEQAPGGPIRPAPAAVPGGAAAGATTET